MYSTGAPGPARRGGNPPVNVPPPIRGAPQSSSMPGPVANASAASTRIGEMLDQVKAEYEAAVHQLNMTKMEQIEVERKLQAQVLEMDQIQQTLKTLETNHRRIRQQYEEDMMRMRRQLEGQQPAGVKLPAKRHRTPTNSGSGPSMGGQEGDSLMSVVAAAAASSRGSSGNPRSNSPVRVVPVQPASRSLQQLGQPPVPQGAMSQGPPPPSTQLSPLEGQSTTPTNRRNGPIPPLNSRDPDSKKGDRSAPGSQSGQSSPVVKKAKSNDGNSIPSLSNGKGNLPSLNRDRERDRDRDRDRERDREREREREREQRGDSSPSSTTSAQSQQAGSTPTGAGTSSNQEATTPQGEGSTSTSAGTSNASKSSGSKGSKLNWNCVYNNNTSSHPDPERPVAELHQTMDHQSVVCCVRFSPDGTMMATGCHKTARVFDVKTGERKFIVSRPGGNGANGASSEEDAAYVRAVAFSPDCTKLVAGMPHNTIRVWDIASNEEGPAMTGHESEIYALDFVNDMIVSGSGDRKVRLWDARTGQCKKIFGSESGGPSDGVTSVALSPDGRYLAAGSLDKVVRIWDTESSQLIDRFEGHSDSVYSIAFSPDGKNVISGSLDKNIMLWDVNAQGRTASRPRTVFQGHKDFVLSVAYTPDGRWLMSGSKDRSVIFWDPRHSRSVLTLTGYRNSVISVASSPSSPYFATGSGDCLAVVWKYQCQSF